MQRWTLPSMLDAKQLQNENNNPREQNVNASFKVIYFSWSVINA